MAEESRFFDSENDPITGLPDRLYDSDDFAAVFATMAGTDGILASYGNALDVVEDTPPSMGVVLRSGKAFVQGRQYENSADLDLEIDPNASGSTRIDRIVLRLDYDARTLTAEVLKGTPGAGAPALTQDATVWEYPVKRVTVASGDVSISNAEITTDDRTYLADLGTALPKSGGTMTGELIVDRGTPKVSVGGASTFGAIVLEKDAATAASDEIGRITFRGQDSGGNVTDYAMIRGYAPVVTNGSERGRMSFHSLIGGVDTELLRFSTRLLLPQNTIGNSNDDRQFTWGTGSPEGVVTASPGSLFLRTDGAAGTTLYVKETGTGTSTGWKAGGSKTVRMAWTILLPNEIKVPSGSTDYVPGAALSVPTAQSVTLVGYQWFLNAGTSFTFKLQHKTGATLGTNTDLVTGVVAASASVKGAGTFTNKVCADQDFWFVVVTGVSGTPMGGAVAIVADVTF